MSVNNKVRKNIGQFLYGFFGISDLRSVNDFLKLTAYDGIFGNESKSASKILKMIINLVFIVRLP